ncbi:acetylornithine deacetylase [Faucicola mancuniensis]|uniref:acetylornithine deacetylase n=1 Tax=Faucicola mancuniensis TaxID=1309795 RepID=UPI0028F1502C|nr:acetylornithine deacetylase [uncultured Moraxella sp.]
MTYPNNTIDWLKKLISFDTTSRYSNLELIHYVKNFCQSLNLSPRLTFNNDQTKANLFVTVPATNSGQAIFNGGFVFSGHTDVVPVDGQVWDSDPFSATIKDGKLYGRGACDMKGFIACCLAILPSIVKQSNENNLTNPIHFALSFDEEIGCLGMPLLLDDLQQQGIKPDYCIVGEPTMMKMVTAHKGIQVYHCRVHGKSAHSSLTPQGVNAISYASKIINFIDDLAEKLQHEEQDLAFDVPFSTLSVGTINGGTATNVVPNLCEFTFDFRNLPHVCTESVILPIREFIQSLNQKMQAVDNACFAELHQDCNVPAMNDDDSIVLQVLIENLVDEKMRHKVAYATEGGQFTNAGIPTVICGCGDIAQAHKANEFVSLEQLEKCEKFLMDIVKS